MHDRPNVHELLDVVQTFLDEEIVPATKGRKQFLARVAANCVRMVDRELGAETKQFERAWSGLDELFGPEAPATDRVERSLAVTGRLDLLCERIREGALDEDSESWGRTLAFVRDRVRDKLEVSNPKLLATDAKRGIG